MVGIDVNTLKRSLIAAGMEVFRVRGEEVHLAERQNIQLMEAGVRVRGGASPAVTVVLRAQRSDAPALTAQSLYDLVRERAAPLVADGWAEVEAEHREIRNVGDPTHLLDVWYEVTFRREVPTIEEAVVAARRAVSTDRYVVP